MDRELTDSLHVVAHELDGRSQQGHVGSCNGAQRSVVEARDPRDNRPIAEAQHQFGRHGDLTALANHQPDNARMPAAQRHEIDQQGGAGGRLKASLQDQAVAAIASRHFRLVARRDLPAPVFAATYERGETGVGIKARPAQPINRAIAPHESRCLAVADQPIIFDAGRHGTIAESR
jgi:hypothetical protein